MIYLRSGGSMKKYETVIFDLDDTLIDNHESIKYAFKVVLRVLDINYSDILLNKWKSHDTKYWHSWETGELNVPRYITKLEDKITYLRANRFIRFFKVLDLSFEDAVSLNDIYCNNLGVNIVEVKGANDLLSSINNREIVIATNGPKDAAINKLEKANLNSYISLLVSSEEVGHSKPNSEFFDYMIYRCDNKNKDNMLLVGDGLSTDILGGMNNNIDTCFYNPNNIVIPNTYKPTMSVNKLKELKRRLK